MELGELIKARRGEVREKTEKRRHEAAKHLHEKLLRNEEETKQKIGGLPNELWAEILPHVKDPQDLGNMWKSHSRLRPLSGESQTLEYLLSQVLSIEKLPYLWEDNTTRLSKLKMFRTFSRGMRTAVDSLIEENLTKALGSNEQRPLYSYGIGPNPIHGSLKCLKGLYENFCEGLEEKGAKRVFHRSIAIHLSEPITKDVVYRPGYPGYPCEILVLGPSEKTKITSLLEMIGDQIWYFRTSVSPNKFNTEYPFLRHCVSQMPNLKWFTLVMPLPRGSIAQEILDDYPFPHLEHLERITFSGVWNVQQESAVVASVIRPNLQIKILELNGSIREDNLFLKEELAPLLAILNLDGFYGNYDWTRPRMDILQPVVCTKWKLKSFSHSFASKSEFLELATLLNFLNNIPTLEHLSLGSLRVFIENEIIPPLRLPHLTHFHFKFEIRTLNFARVENIVFFTSLQFLMESKKLQDLSWTLDGNGIWTSRRASDSFKHFKDFMRRHEEIEKIQFKCGYQENLTIANLWNVFPCLEYLKICVPCHSDNIWRKKIRDIRRLKLLSLE